MNQVDLVKSVYVKSYNNLANAVEEFSLKSAIETVIYDSIEEIEFENSLKSIIHEAVQEVLEETDE